MKPLIIAIFTVLWAASLYCAYRAGHVVSTRSDYAVPEKVKALVGSWSETEMATNDWLRAPRFRPFGRFVCERPENRQEAALLIGINGKPVAPLVFITDDAKSGRPDSFMLYDAAGNSVSARDKNRDGVFDVIDLVTTNGHYRDEGLSGSWKFRKVPE